MNKDFRLAYDVLDKVFRDGAYSNILLGEVLDMSDNRALVTKLVYGVLEKDITLEYYLSQLMDTKPQKKVMTILKLGIYILNFMNSIPDYACVNDMVELCNYANKEPAKGFVNAILKKAVGYQYQLPKDKFERISVEYSVPVWLVKAYIKQYGELKAIEIINTEEWTYEHIRSNKRMISDEELASYMLRRDIEFMTSEYGGYYVKNNPAVRKLFNDGVITFQSPSSMLACKAMNVTGGAKVLDLCASPGGKSVLLSELGKKLDITACDIYSHRVDLINDYAKRMKAIGITAIENDATVLREDFKNKFDYVLCDVPCSGLGVAHKKPDIYLSKTYEGVCDLAELQYQILNNAIEYTKTGGVIVYSTCTTLREENYNIIGKTLKMRSDVKLEKMNINIENDGFVQLLPSKGVDGFFIARLIKC